MAPGKITAVKWVRSDRARFYLRHSQRRGDGRDEEEGG